MSHYYAKFKENPCVGTDANTPFDAIIWMESINTFWNSKILHANLKYTAQQKFSTDFIIASRFECK